MEWKSVHIFIHDFRSVDDYIRTAFSDLISILEDKFEKYFYIRYWLGGPHIRLRFILREEKDYDEVISTVRSNVKAYLKDKEINIIDRNSYYKKEMLELENIQEVGWFEHGSVQNIPYEPEIERYGGEDKIHFSEEMFYRSSVFTLKVNKLLNFQQKIIIAFDLMILSFYLFPSTLSGYEYYYKMWEKLRADRFLLIDQMAIFEKRYAEIMSRPDEYLEKYNMYFESFKNGMNFCRTENLRQNLAILISHMHMTNNRLGIMPEIEYELAKIVYKLKEVEYAK